jgi:uncharacterized protein
MRNLIKNMPLPIEFAIVVAGAFGLSIIDSIQAVLHLSPGVLQSEAGMWHDIGLEVVIFLILGGLLWLRGWTTDRLGLQSHWMDGLHGAALAVAAYLAIVLVVVALNTLVPQLAQAAAKLDPLPKVLSLWIIAALVLVDSFCEEFFLTGYIISALKEKAGESVAVNVSVGIRLLCQIHQGVFAVVVIPIGLIFGYWYARTGRLWPVMVGHAALNLVLLLPYVKS